MTSQNYFSCFTSFIISDCCAGLSCTRYSEYSQYLVVYFSHNEHFLIRISFPFSANDKRLRNVNGVTNPNGGAVPPPVQRTPLSDPDMDNESLDNSRNSENEGYMREVKAIIGGVLGFWGGVGGLGTMFLVVVLSQRYCCKENEGKDDGDG